MPDVAGKKLAGQEFPSSRSVCYTIFRVGCLWLFLAVSVFKVDAQEPYQVNGRIIVSPPSFQEVKVNYRVNNRIKQLALSPEGTFEVGLAWNHEYLFTFQKPGFITKAVQFSTRVPADVDKAGLQPFLLMVKLTPLMENVDTAYFKNPVGYVRFNDKISDFEPVTDYDLLVKYNKECLPAVLPNQEAAGARSDSGVNNELPVTADPGLKAKQPSSLSASHNRVQYAARDTTASPYGQLRHFKSFYPQGVTADTFHVGRQVVNRYVVQKGEKRSVYLKVTHHWGPAFYFIFYPPAAYRSISRDSFLSRVEGF